MGTNYYWRRDFCGQCGRYDEVHVCKSLISFQGSPMADELGRTVVSWQDWKRLLTEDAAEIVDEYGNEYTADEFIAKVEATDPEARRRQFDYVRQQVATIGIGPDLNWLDSDGFSFYGGEFR